MQKHTGTGRSQPVRGFVREWRCGKRLAVCAALVLATLVQVPLSAQPKSKKAAQPKSKKAVQPKSKKAAPPAGPPLPVGFVPPPPLPLVMGLNNPLLTPKQELDFRRSRTGNSAFIKAVRSTSLNARSQKDLRAGVRFLVARLTMPIHREMLPARRREIRTMVQLQAKASQVRNFLLSELTKALSELLVTAKFKITEKNGQQIEVVITRPDPRTGKDQSRSFKAGSFEALKALKGAAEAVQFYQRHLAGSIFAGQAGLQNFHVRLNAAYLLGELVAKKGDVGKGIPDSRYTPAAATLCDVVDDPRQLDAIKVIGVRGLVRLMQTGLPEPSYDLQLRVAECFVNQLKRPYQQSLIRQRSESHLQHVWYQEVLVEGLAGVGILVNKQSRPFVETTLASVLADPQRHFLARTAAAKALGRAPLGSGFDDGLRSYQLAELAGQMAVAYNKVPTAGYWSRCYQQLYFAFKAIDKKELTVAGKPAGLLGQVSTNRLQETYRQIVPLVAHVIVQPVVAADGRERFLPISSQAMAPLAEWLQKNRPANYKPVPPPGATPVSRPPASKTKKTAPASGGGSGSASAKSRRS